MFTGLVEEVGTVRTFTQGTVAQLRLAAPQVSAGTKIGDSIAINGVCLTVTRINGQELSFDAVEETLAKSSLSKLRPGDGVNLERSVSAERLFGGHFVLGHVDAVGTISSFRKQPGIALLVIEAPDDVLRYVVPKGSIAVDGISLTVAACDDREFTVAVIPHTIDSTVLSKRRPGDIVNLEADILGKYIEKFVSNRSQRGGVTARLLTDSGFWED